MSAQPGGHTFRVWAPDAPSVTLVLGAGDQAKSIPMKKVDVPSARSQGWWEAVVKGAGHGSDYGFLVEKNKYNVDKPLPDPRGFWLPTSVHGPSRVYNHDQFKWTDKTWRGVPLAGSVLYELHVGTFSEEGTFDGAIKKLDHLVNLGIDAIELLPCNAFPGQWNWGYDGVGLYAVQESYGGPDGLKRLVDACHARGIGVIMDVVYNHLGPDGNYLECFGPYFSTKSNSWGTSVNLDGPWSDEVRSFFIDNALMWLEHYHIDGLRLDAVHALLDTSATHFLEDLANHVRNLSARLRKPLFLIAESDLNDPRLIKSPEAGGYGLDAQWADDVHHSLHALLTGERQGYYGDFGSLEVMAKALRGGFVHDGEWSSFRKRKYGRPIPTTVPTSRLVVFLQDHDQIGNRAVGDRISEHLNDNLLRIGAALLLMSPFTPMLFQGEEWGAKTPFQFFTNHNKELGELVKKGRRAEFAEHGWNTEDVPDPQDPETFKRSKLNWNEPTQNKHASLLDWYKSLIHLRRSVPEIAKVDEFGQIECEVDEEAKWLVLRRSEKVATVVNLGKKEQTIPVIGDGHNGRKQIGDILLSHGSYEVKGAALTLGPESVAIVRIRG
ncbi:malto-oligosyltrehalose trehalohydrolase [Spizellomyces punctatus DAOM BR117]|uniref:1,4-alpha-glucan-branching enzyme n=1 Tax=Spizellomyces punctatus (strain DAOM BR117) TaxID=645134 RepID=A0A0L0HLC2_SPIPD|nr:malto-oligosyltrehalose trehalohydrolase [Spizellomyces punctatus DAOM BR117]KND01695.1 malto-oligosyltrehalose trehalohydrolase [Spizellomyces punctatus DAOM BR117]|eukprot:XP_016609734.1 malto-oligosyltrehalose trehalohydrolase [Spizellomyces punctatus DAOM BR117]